MSGDTGICYFSLNTKHLVRLVVSLWSLRQHYRGPVTILDAGGSDGITEKIAADARLAVERKAITIRQFRRHSAYCAKASLWRESPYENTILLDCDTLILRPLDGLIAIVENERLHPFFVTRFSDWRTDGKIVGGRIQQWEKVTCDGLDVPRLVRDSLREPHAAINTGVTCWRKYDAQDVLIDWENLTLAGWRCSFTDELAAQLLLREHKHTLLSDRYNCSVLFGREKEHEVIRHHHGSKHLRPEDGQLWHSAYANCLAENVAGIRDWTPAGDPALIEWQRSAAI
jgi:hypothetical protein